jgi:BASS family bile acid:Na+ symporter
MSGPIVMAFFILLVLFLKTTVRFQVYLLPFAAVSASLYYLTLFTGFGDSRYKELIVPLLMVIMFGMSIKDFVLIGKMPSGVLIGLVCQFSIMPIIGFG